MINPISVLAMFCLLVVTSCLVYASGLEINDAVVTQNDTENDYMNKPYQGFIGINLHFPDEINENTGLMTLIHGWGGEYHQYDSYANDWRNRYNVICLQVQYRDSGKEGIAWEKPYDFGKYQAIDVLRSIQYVRENYAINDERIIGWGGSGGGNIILQAAKMAPNTFALAIDCSGITRPTNSDDILANYENDGRNNSDGWEGAALKAGDRYTLPERQIRSAQYHAAYFNTSVHILHGDKDTLVDYQHAVDMYEALIAAGKEAHLHTIVNGSHSFDGADRLENTRREATDKYVADDILNRRSAGETDFELESKIQLPTDGDCIYLIDYKGSVPTLYVTAPTTVGPAGKLAITWGIIKNENQNSPHQKPTNAK